MIYPHLKGIGGGSEEYNELRLTYDTRDSIDIPRKGGLALIYGGFADRSLMSSVSYTRFGGEVRHYWSFGKRFTLAAPRIFAVSARRERDALLLDGPLGR